MTIRPLTPKQARFVTEYLVDGNGTQAAIRAGYSPRTANEQAARLLAKVNIAAAVSAQRAALDRVTIADATERRETLTIMLRDAAAHPIARLKAADILNKMDGLYVLRHAGADGGPLIPAKVVHEHITG